MGLRIKSYFFKHLFMLVIINVTFMMVIFLFSGIQKVSAQSETDFDALKQFTFDTLVVKPVYKQYNVETGTLKQLVTILFIGYKKFISSQDAANCPFHPSCSEYFVQSVQKKGIIWGTLNGIDRLKRCNGYDMDKYFYDETLQRYLDEIK